MTDQTRDIVERLRRTEVTFQRGGKFTPRQDPVNPDGPEAADTIEALTKRVAELTSDRDEWKHQHENLLGIYRDQTVKLHRRTELLRRTLAYLPSTYGLTQTIRDELPPQEPGQVIDAAIDDAALSNAARGEEG